MRKLLLSFLLMLALSLSAAAQDATDTPEGEPSPFLRALALIPDIAPVREAGLVFSYADYHAALAARDIERPETLAAFVEDRDAYGPILPALPMAGPANLITYLVAGGPDYPETVGFDFFEVAQAVEIGAPPQNGQILLGEFSADAVESAYIARDYVVERESENGVMLCPSAGCDSGAQIDFRSILPGNPFGGELGRTEPLFVDDGILLNSPYFPLVETMAATYEGSGASLADAPAFQAVDAVLGEYPYVTSVIAASPQMFGVLDLSFALGDAQAQLAEEITAQLEAAPLAPYQAAAFASTADNENEYGLALLVYADADAAQEAAAAIDARLESMQSVRVRRSYADVLTDAGTLEPSAVVTDEATGLSVVVVRASKPLPSNEPGDDGMVMGSHLVYRRFYEMIISRDNHWLIWGGGEQ